MNTVALARLLGRHLAVENASRLGGDAALDVIAAINAGLQEFHVHAPARLKRVTVSRTVRAPQDVTLTVTAPYSRALTAQVFTEEQTGCTVAWGPDPDNAVAAPDALLNERLSPTLSGAARVFCDALPLDAPVERLSSDVRLSGDSVGGRRILTRDDRLRDRQHTEGPPSHYQFEESAEGAPLLRLWPLPAGDALLRFEAECSPLRLTFAHLARPTEIPLPDHLAETILLPLCLNYLTTSPLWADERAIPRIEDAAQRALLQGIPRIPHDTGIPNNRVGTQKGF